MRQPIERESRRNPGKLNIFSRLFCLSIFKRFKLQMLLYKLGEIGDPAFARGLREGFWGERTWVMDCFV